MPTKKCKYNCDKISIYPCHKLLTKVISMI